MQVFYCLFIAIIAGASAEQQRNRLTLVKQKLSKANKANEFLNLEYEKLNTARSLLYVARRTLPPYKLTLPTACLFAIHAGHARRYWRRH